METTERTRRFPIGASVTLADLDRDPYPTLARLREHEPVSWVPEVGMWFLTQFDDVSAVLGDVQTFTVDAPGSIIQEMFGRHMMTTDGDVQIAHKRACIGPFKPGALNDRARPAIHATVDRLLAALDDTPTTDLRRSLARPLAIETVAQLLGFPPRDFDRIRGWYDRFAAALANFTRNPEVAERGRMAVGEFRGRVAERLVELRSRADDSLLGTLGARGAHDLGDEEIASNALIIMFGGIETTDAMISNAVWALLRHPKELDAVRRDRRLLRPAMDESLRWEPAVQSCTRHATRDTSLGGVTIRKGEIVQCMIGGANRDPRRFSDPDHYDITRPNAREHLSFGAGRHYCLGAPLALLEAEIAINGLLDRFPGMAPDPERPAALRGYEFRKPPELWVRL